MARRAVPRATENSRECADSVGSGSPGRRAPDEIRDRNSAAIWRYPTRPLAVSPTWLVPWRLSQPKRRQIYDPDTKPPGKRGGACTL